MQLTLKSSVSGPRCLRAQKRFVEIGAPLDAANFMLSRILRAASGYTEAQIDDLLRQIEQAPNQIELERLVAEAIALLDAGRADALKLAEERAAAGKASKAEPVPGSDADVVRIEDVTLRNDIERSPGPNRVAKAMAYVASRHRGMSFDERHELACRLVRRAWGIR